MITADAVVIGGGVIGTSIAYRLAEDKRSVILIEKSEIGSQTSGACDKAIFLQSKKPGIHLELAYKSRKIYDTLEEELGFPIEFNKSGGMIAIESEAHLEFMKKYVASQNEAGIKVDLLDGPTAREKQPCLSSHIVGSTYSEEDAEVNPLLLPQAFLNAAKRLGVQVQTQTEVIDIIVKAGRVTGVKTNRGDIATELVINATGPFAPAISKMVDLDLPIQPRRGLILISERMERIVKGNMLCAQYIAAKHVSGDDGPPPPPYGIGLALGQTETGNLLIGSSREFKNFDKQVNPDLITAIASHASRIVPGLNDVRIIRSMVGFRPVTDDGLPIIDKASHIEGFVNAAGHGGDGIALAPITGLLVRSLVNNDDKYADDLAQLTLGRFNISLHE